MAVRHSGARAIRRALLMAAVAAGCAQPPEVAPVPMRWPEPPQTVRIEFVGTISSAADVRAAPGAWETLGRFLGVLEPPRSRPIAHPADVAITPGGDRLYVSDFAQGIVHVIDREAGEVAYLGARAPFERPFGLALDGAGQLYVVEQAARRIRVVAPDGSTTRVVALPETIRPIDVALDEERDRMYVADGARQHSERHYVHVYDLAGTHRGTLGDGRGTTPGALLFPTYLAVDAGGNLHVSDTMNSRVSVFDPDGAFVRAIGARGDGFGLFDKPKGMAFDSFGNLYVVDSSWSNVQIFGPRGDVLLFFGGRGGYGGYLRNPTAIAIEHSTNTIVVGDYLNHRLALYRLVNTGPGDGFPEAVPVSE